MSDDAVPETPPKTAAKPGRRVGARGLVIATVAVVVPGSLAIGALYLGIRAYRRRGAAKPRDDDGDW